MNFKPTKYKIIFSIIIGIYFWVSFSSIFILAGDNIFKQIGWAMLHPIEVVRNLPYLFLNPSELIISIITGIVTILLVYSIYSFFQRKVEDGSLSK